MAQYTVGLDAIRKGVLSLTSHPRRKGSAVQRFIEEEVGPAAPVCKQANRMLRGHRAGEPPVPALPGSDAGLVGMAVEFVLAAAAG
jgi:hypothetical protein